jgi:hypothetical protein
MHRSVSWFRWLMWGGLAVVVGIPAAWAGDDSESGRRVEGSWYGSFHPEGYAPVPVLATLARDGGLTTTDGTDFLGGFQSGTHGSWERDGADGLRMTLLALNFDAAGNFTGHSRTRGSARLNRARDTLSGSFRTDYFQPGQDPLDPAAVPFQSIPATFELRRIPAR